ncbi:hypothetical protein F5879DRAFT_924747 [Lentinula edodes]|nr:hypothetical protein F5879DRAFT_924747 [Lentinula edodes]
MGHINDLIDKSLGENEHVFDAKIWEIIRTFTLLKRSEDQRNSWPANFAGGLGNFTITNETVIRIVSEIFSCDYTSRIVRIFRNILASKSSLRSRIQGIASDATWNDARFDRTNRRGILFEAEERQGYCEEGPRKKGGEWKAKRIGIWGPEMAIDYYMEMFNEPLAVFSKDQESGEHVGQQNYSNAAEYEMSGIFEGFTKQRAFVVCYHRDLFVPFGE